MIQRFAVAQISTPHLSFEEDLTTFVEADVEGIGIWEFKLGEGLDGRRLDAFLASGLRATLAVPKVWSILPHPLCPGPEDPYDRVDLMCHSVRRLAPFDPVAIGVDAGSGRLNEPTSRPVILHGLRKLARTASTLHPRGFDIALTSAGHAAEEDGLRGQMIDGNAEAADLIAEVGEPNLRIVLDPWRVPDDPSAVGLPTYVARLSLVRLRERQGAAADGQDRSAHGIISRLRAAGFRGWFELELLPHGGRHSDVHGSRRRRDVVAIIRECQQQFPALHATAVDGDGLG